MIDPIAPILRDHGVVVLDGALATELERRGAVLDDALWSAKVLLEAPELIEQVHYDYLVAGADLLTTSTYQATFEGLARRGIDEAEAADIFRRSVALAVSARDRFWARAENRRGRPRPLVAASIGPYGAFLADGSEYTGDYGVDRQALMRFHRPRLLLLADSEADLLALETIPSLEEAEALLAVVAEVGDQPAWIGFSCRDGSHVCHGEPFERCVARAAEAEQIVAVGLNCTPPRFVQELVERGAQTTGKPFVVYPNSGETWDAGRRRWLPAEGSESLTFESWIAAGARLVGGCCRTSPETIADLARRVGR